MDWTAIVNGAIYGAITGFAAAVVAILLSALTAPFFPERARRTVRTLLIGVLVVAGVVGLDPVLQKKFGPIIGPAPAPSAASGASHGP